MVNNVRGMDMSLTTEQYLGLSTLAYEDFSEVKKNGKDNLVQELVKGSEKPELKALSGIANWTLIAQSTSSFTHTVTQRGHTRKVTVEIPFSATAFQNPETGEIVFAFRGTNNTGDWGTDLQIAFGVSESSIDQFQLARQFVFETLNQYGKVHYETQEAMFKALNQNSNVSFTGHSLGGGLAQYLSNLFSKRSGSYA